MVNIVDEPPKTVRNKVDWHEVAEAATNNPGKWVEVPVPLTSGMASQIRKGGVRAIDPAKYEVTTRRITGTADQRTFYVRLRGD